MEYNGKSDYEATGGVDAERRRVIVCQVSIMLPPETVWGYDLVTSAYSEKPSESWQRIYDHVKGMYEEADDPAIVKLIGKKPEK